jgi:hypothetical protein
VAPDGLPSVRRRCGAVKEAPSAAFRVRAPSPPSKPFPPRGCPLKIAGFGVPVNHSPESRCPWRILVSAEPGANSVWPGLSFPTITRGYVIAMDDNKTTEEIKEELARTQEYLAELKGSLPKHSVRPHQLIDIEDAEEQVEELLAELSRRPPPMLK